MYSYTQIETQGAEHVRAADQWLKNERLLHETHSPRFTLKGLLTKAFSHLRVARNHADKVAGKSALLPPTLGEETS